MNLDTETLDEEQLIQTSEGAYSFTISSHIHKRLEKHILILKKLVDRKTTKQRWLINAVKEKLEKDANSQQVPKANTLTVKLEQELEKELLLRIDFIKKFRSSYSKKQWLVEAILDKLEKDEMKVEEKMLDSKHSTLSQKQKMDQLQAEIDKLKNFLSNLQL